MIVSSHTIAEFTHEALRLSRPLKPGQPLSTVALLSPLPPPPYTHTNAHTKKGGGAETDSGSYVTIKSEPEGNPAEGLLMVYSGSEGMAIYHPLITMATTQSE